MSGDPMRQAAQRALEEWPLDGEAPAGHVQRISVDVNLGEGNELVALRLSPRGLSWVCSCAQPRCEHARTAIGLIAGVEMSAAPGGRVSSTPPAPTVVEERTSDVYESRLSSSPGVRVVDQFERAYQADAEGLANALDDVVTAVARVGARAGEGAASVRDSLGSLLEVAPTPLPLGLSRWIGRLNLALADRDVDGLARALHGASCLAADLRVAAPDGTARARIGSWLGALSGDVKGVDRLSDRTMLEIGREWVDGVELASVERRYLLDLRSGDIFLEEKGRDSRGASLGPCPRTLHIGLAEVDTGVAPRRIRLLQYAATPTVSQGAWDLAASWAVRDFSILVDRHRDAISTFPGIAEPFAIVAHEALTQPARPCLLDASGRPLPLTCGQEPEGLHGLATVFAMGPVKWLAGRLVDVSGAVQLRPLAAAATVDGHTTHHCI